ncbi:nuclease-related domain-containing protein [Bacillus sp. N1-1]|uniref:nuclease-related domain-containing protein n=1 Tax=Bacillus sp. N1-1 TaxID=2682541 RepID=UPI0013187C69|nr:nuclease-related domain-containing protein [Bacillus sp. N1-1]QHA93331.1 NERD domain-containing protein [Bacillus sp. N1-1]
MIKKDHDPPHHLHKLSLLLNRLPSYHSRIEEVKEQIAMYQAGLSGEKSLNFPLSFLDDKRFSIYHDLRLFDGAHYFQIDTLVVTQCYLLILEVKNISGTLMFDPTFNQLIRISDTKEEAFPNPLTQVERQCSQLRALLQKMNIPEVPIETLIVVANRRAVLKATEEVQFISSKVIRGEYLPTKVKLLDKRYGDERLTVKEVRKLGRILVKLHEPIDRDVLKRFSITPDELLVGVVCPACARLAMQRLHGRWFCESCGTYSRNAHLRALQEYALLVSREITNQKARRFLKMDSGDAATRLLRSLNLESTGSTKGRRYKLDLGVSRN